MKNGESRMANGKADSSSRIILPTSRRDIEERTFRFAARVVRLAGSLPETPTGRLFANQVLRAGTSVGANVHEAQDSPTKKDFTWRINVARCEARETLYWLRLMAETKAKPAEKLAALTTEANELVSILTAIVKTARTSLQDSASTKRRAIRHS